MPTRYTEATKMEDVVEAAKKYPEINDFLSSYDSDWVSQAFETSNDELVGLFYRHKSQQQRGRLKVLEKAFSLINPQEDGAGELKEKIFEQQSGHDALAEVYMVGKLRKVYGVDPVEMNPDFTGCRKNPDILVEMEDDKIVVEVTRTSAHTSLPRSDSSGALKGGNIPMSEKNHFGSKVKNKVEQLKPLRDRDVKVMLAMNTPFFDFNKRILNSYLQGQTTDQIITNKETGEPVATRQLQDTPVLNLEHDADIFDYILQFDEPAYRLYASHSVSEGQVSELEEVFGVKRAYRYVNNIDMDYDEYQRTRYN